jgi:hypothetical protein
MGIKRKYNYAPLPRWNFDVLAGHGVLTHRVKENAEWVNEDTVIEPAKFRGVFDLAHGFEIGWVAYLTGVGLDAHLVNVRSGEDYAAKPPSDKHREGIRLIASFDGTAHELVTTSVKLWDAISALDDSFMEGVKEHPGHLPLVGVDEVIKEKGKNDVNLFVPVFKILKFVPRLKELPLTGIPLFKWQKKKDVASGGDGYTRPTPQDMNDSVPFS